MAQPLQLVSSQTTGCKVNLLLDDSIIGSSTAASLVGHYPSVCLRKACRIKVKSYWRMRERRSRSHGTDHFSAPRTPTHQTPRVETVRRHRPPLRSQPRWRRAPWNNTRLNLLASYRVHFPRYLLFCTNPSQLTHGKRTRSCLELSSTNDGHLKRQAPELAQSAGTTILYVSTAPCISCLRV